MVLNIIAIDPSARSTGLCFNGLEYEKIVPSSKLGRGPRVVHHYNEIGKFLDLWKPKHAFLEGAVHTSNPKASIIQAEIRGTYLLALQKRNIPFYEINAQTLKKFFGIRKKCDTRAAVEKILELDLWPQIKNHLDEGDLLDAYGLFMLGYFALSNESPHALAQRGFSNKQIESVEKVRQIT